MNASSSQTDARIHETIFQMHFRYRDLSNRDDITLDGRREVSVRIVSIDPSPDILKFVWLAGYPRNFSTR